MQPWKTLSRRTILNHSKYLAVEEHAVELPDGRVIPDWPWIITPDYVNVAAMDSDGRFLVFRQNKYGIDGTSFAPRSAVTLARYAKLGLSYGAPLNQSGEMRGQIAFDAGADYVEVGSNAIQAAVMQFGAAQGEFGASIGKDKLGRDHFHTIPWGDIPARPFIGLSDEDQTNIVAEVEKWLERAAGSGA